MLTAALTSPSMESKRAARFADHRNSGRDYTWMDVSHSALPPRSLVIRELYERQIHD